MVLPSPLSPFASRQTSSCQAVKAGSITLLQVHGVLSAFLFITLLVNVGMSGSESFVFQSDTWFGSGRAASWVSSKPSSLRSRPPSRLISWYELLHQLSRRSPQECTTRIIKRLSGIGAGVQNAISVLTGIWSQIILLITAYCWQIISWKAVEQRVDV